MGIEGFYRTLEKKNNDKIGIIKDFDRKTDTEFFYIDFNSILYNISATIDTDLAYILACIIYDYDDKCEAISKKWKFKLDTATIEGYTSYFTQELTDQFTIEFVKEHISTLLTTYTDPEHLKRLFISVDGIPNMAKIVEQKQRKYMTYVRNTLVKKIFKKYQEKGELSEKRILFEKTRIRFDRGKIVPWSPFMKKLEGELINKKWVDTIKDKFPKLEGVVLSGSAYPGEGEKKIMENIRDNIENKIGGNYMLYSPDADIILLSIILKNFCYINSKRSTNKFYVLHYDQESKAHSFIDIGTFCTYICSFIVERADKDMEIDSELIFKVTNDFVIIATVFGNDFVPKIDSISVKNDFLDILELYRHMFDSSGNLKNIVIAPDNIKGTFRINYGNLLKYMSYVSNIEDDLIRQKYIADNYNIATIKKLLNSKSASERQTYKFVKEYIDEYGKFVKAVVEKGDIPILISEYSKTNRAFLEKLVALEIRKSRSIGRSINDVSTEIASNILKKYNDSGRITKPLSSIRKSRHGSLQEFHVQKYFADPINKLMNDKEGDLTNYDREIILLDWKLDEYAKMLNSLITDNEDVNFGSVTLNYRNYKLYLPYINRDYYYKSYLGINQGDTASKQYILREYLFGLIWTFDFYFNKNDSKYNLMNVSTWFYPLHKAPLLKEVVQSLEYFVKTGKVNIFTDKIDRNIVSRSNFLNRYEQLLYTVPKNRIHPIIKGYEKLLEDESLFPDMDDYVSKIWNTSTSSQYIDCRRITFITKCILKRVHNYSFKDFMSIVKPYRRYLAKSDIQFGYTTRNVVVEYSGEREQMQGGSDVLLLLNYYRNMYKRLYLETKHINYKYIYKEAKKHLDTGRVKVDSPK
jgi:5'-3' exonuclease